MLIRYVLISDATYALITVVRTTPILLLLAQDVGCSSLRGCAPSRFSYWGTGGNEVGKPPPPPRGLLATGPRATRNPLL